MTDYDRAIAIDNLKRAYRWIQSNPDPLYKSHFASSYAAFAGSSAANLKRLRKHLQRRDYHPGHASKLYFPKPSGILRPFTLLSVNDQIVYQACVNIVAERLNARVRKRHSSRVFGNVYAGKRSKFFYREWRRQYRSYTRCIINHVDEGFDWVADFDLASFYDSIDHNVLAHFLHDIRVSDDLIEFLLTCLKQWTASTWTSHTPAIYHEHGIPQGPLSSGLLSESILQHIDTRGERGKGSEIRYLRYVDDIKLFAKSEEILRRKLVGLDLAAKEIGLFPQSSKINIRRIVDPSHEIKSVSIPPDPALSTSASTNTQRKKIKRLIRELLSPQPEHVQSATRFKYLLGNVRPHHELNLRLITLLERRPELFRNICWYFEKYTVIPKKPAALIADYVCREHIYHAPQAALLFSTINRLPEPHATACLKYCYERLTGRKRAQLYPQPTLKAAFSAWCIFHAKLTYVELRDYLNEENEWWVKQFIITYLDESHFGKPSYEWLLNELIQDTHADVARAAALSLVTERLEFKAPTTATHESAKLLLLEAGLIKTIGKPRSLVGVAIEAISKVPATEYDWATVLGAEHRMAERAALDARTYFESNSLDAAIVQIDALLDLIFEKIFYKIHPRKTYPNYGSALHNKDINRTLPYVCDGFKKVHELRVSSHLSHMRNRRTKKLNRRLKHSDFNSIRKSLTDAIQELIRFYFI